jgi:hypothetical protein
VIAHFVRDLNDRLDDEHRTLVLGPLLRSLSGSVNPSDEARRQDRINGWIYEHGPRRRDGVLQLLEYGLAAVRMVKDLLAYEPPNRDSETLEAVLTRETLTHQPLASLSDLAVRVRYTDTDTEVTDDAYAYVQVLR